MVATTEFMDTHTAATKIHAFSTSELNAMVLLYPRQIYHRANNDDPNARHNTFDMTSTYGETASKRDAAQDCVFNQRRLWTQSYKPSPNKFRRSKVIDGTLK